ncbi:copper resistance protein CopC [Paenibacillus macerans]|uniref:copper resistance CopC/CopD family protein n=1 Tax=Paenibacillus macerans TaxID=44252 RepID=UPI00203C7C13|nr:copper resistance protein CopC [Paenibacillus macerans]MCM3701790.1 copper resistance protein CopC [Paenibacillus macerans]
MKSRWCKWAALMVLACFVALGMRPPAALAHAYVVSSTPAADETLDQAPSSVRIEFNEPIEAGFYELQVIGPSGVSEVAGEPVFDPEQPTRLSVALKPDLPEGAYAAKWKVVSGDGHPVSGTISFQIGQGASSSVPQHDSTAQNSFPSWSLLAVRWLFYGGMALYLGTLAFHLWLLPAGKQRSVALPERLKRRSRTALLLGFAAAAAAVLLSLPQQTASDSGGGWSKAFDPGSLQETLIYTSFGEIWGYQAMLLIVLLTATLLLLRAFSKKSCPGRLLLALAFAAGLGLLLAKAFIGHAATASVKSAAVTADFLHLAAGLIWLGGVGAVAFLLPAAVARPKPLPAEALAEPARTSAPVEALAEPARTSTPAEALAEPARTSAPVEALAEPARTSAPAEALAEPARASTPVEALAEPARASAPATDPDAATGGLVDPSGAPPAATAADSPQHTLYWRAVRRFSMLAAGCVAVLIFTGVYGSLLHVPTWYALFHSDYGKVLLGKILLTLVCLGLGLSAFLRGRKPSRPLGAGVWTEFALGLVVLALAALLANLPTAAANPGPAQLTNQLPDGSRLTISISPNLVGSNTFQAVITGPDGQPRRDIEQVTLELTSKEMDMGTVEIGFPGQQFGSDPPEAKADGIITMGGRWNVHVHILLKSLDTLDYDTELRVGSK